MEEWKEYKYTELCTLIGGGTPKTSEASYWGGDIPWLSVKDFGTDRKYVYTTEKTITKDGLEKSSTKLLQKDDIIISARGTIGAMAMIVYPMAFNQSCFGIRGNDLVDKDFLYYLTKTKIAELQKNSHGSVFETITRDTFAKLSCIVPPLKKQEEISSILSSLDSKIEVNRRINENLEQQAQALFKSWFVDFEPFKNQPFVESELGMIPQGWRVELLGNIIDIKYGKDHKKLLDGDFPVYGSGGLMRYVEKALYSGESVLIPRKGSLNNVMYVDEAFWTVDTMFYSIPKIANVMLYVYIFLCNRDLSSMNAGSAVPSMTTEILNNMKLVFPSSIFLEKYNSAASSLFIKIKKNDIESRRLAELRDTLLPRLMSGELKVNDLENNEI